MDLATALILLWLLLENHAPWWLYVLWVLGCIKITITFHKDRWMR